MKVNLSNLLSPEVLSSASHKGKWFAKNVFKNSVLDVSGIMFLPVFPFRTNAEHFCISHDG